MEICICIYITYKGLTDAGGDLRELVAEVEP